MSDEALKAQVTRKALELCVDRLTRGTSAAPEILESTRRQLEWLVAYFEGRNTEREKLRTLVFGHYAVREVDECDREFVDALAMAFYVASRTAHGLKVDWRALGMSKDAA
jgi:hypothetical protein